LEKVEPENDQQMMVKTGGRSVMRHHLALAIDLGWVALTAVLAVLIRDNFVPYESHYQAAVAYVVITVAVCSVVFVASGTHKTIWQYTSLPDVLRIMAVITIGLLLALFVSFVLSRLEGVARSVPVIQWFLLVSAMIGWRLAFRLQRERATRHQASRAEPSVEHVLIVGLSHLTELYLQSVAEYAPKTVDVVGILSEERELRGRLLRFCKVLGTPEELPQVMAQLEVHGVSVGRIVVMQPFEQLSRRAAEVLVEAEHAADIKVDWMAELLGLTESRAKDSRALKYPAPTSHQLQTSVSVPDVGKPSISSYTYVKRVLDILGAISLSFVLAPLLLVVGVLVALDVGFPLVFWQKRPGRDGRPFKLFKFCTMRPAHDAEGHRMADEDRSSIIGRLLRRTRLDELPQLYNILVGEMSFVGPRPLLPADQPTDASARLFVRPGLTGLAQVIGGRDIAAEDKNALDIWYVGNVSLWLDFKIILRTPIVLIMGERVDAYAVQAARAALECLKFQGAAKDDADLRLHEHLARPRPAKVAASSS
jgi:lipopolysaccharide/colanic/teichoic acid biosynthesis glycosyltransferase